MKINEYLKVLNLFCLPSLLSPHRPPAMQVIPGLSFLLCHPRAIFFIMSSPGTLFFLVIPGLRPGDPSQSYGFFFIWILGSSPRMTVPLCSSQLPPEHRGLFSTVLSTCRAPVAPVIPGQCFFSRHPRALYFFTVIPGLDPGIQVNNKANL